MPSLSAPASRLALLLVPFSMPALPQTATLTLSATLLPACEAGSTSGTGAISFGTLDFGQYANLANGISITSQRGAGSIRVKCLSGQTFSIRLDGGLYGSVAQRRLANTSNSAQTVAYNLYRDAAGTSLWDNSVGVSATGSGSDQWFPLYGRIPAQTTPPAGRYSDTVNVTISW
ncbi:MAG: hypothetical protein GAK45_01111 [Pseudomonas citronellolis]|nr:MAG: hypothetical protein GAK45_01111 [Pseudomonas citronellolis]